MLHWQCSESYPFFPDRAEMIHTTRAWMRTFIPPINTAGPRERARAACGAFAGLGIAGVLSCWFSAGSLLLIAPMGASAVLLFCLPASPLAQPWSVVGGNMVSAIVGVACAHWIANPMLAAPLAGCLAIAVMFQLRCLHPPGGAVALTAVLGGPVVHAAGFAFVLAPVGLNSVLMAGAALLYNNLTGRRYPHTQQPASTRTGADLDTALAHYGQVLDVSRDDLEAIFLDTEMQAYARRAGVVRCADIMATSLVTLGPTDALAQAWRLMRLHKCPVLPVVDRAGRLLGMLAQADVLQRAGIDGYSGLRERLRLLFAAPGQGQVGTLMVSEPGVAAQAPMQALAPLMLRSRVQHVCVVDDRGVLVGMVSQSGLLAALCATRAMDEKKAPD
jgi:CBS domain-containing membrane protein